MLKNSEIDLTSLARPARACPIGLQQVDARIIVAVDRVVTHLCFKGHFTGTWKEVKGQGQPIDFIGTDIYRIANGKIAENWHLEDNLTLLQQVGIVGK